MSLNSLSSIGLAVGRPEIGFGFRSADCGLGVGVSGGLGGDLQGLLDSVWGGIGVLALNIILISIAQSVLTGVTQIAWFLAFQTNNEIPAIHCRVWS